MDRIVKAIALTGIMLLCLTPITITGQELVFEKQSSGISKRPNFGPNRKYFSHLFLTSSIYIAHPSASYIKTIQPFTGHFALGYRLKLKLMKPLALIAEGGFNKSYFKLLQTTGKVFPDTYVHRSQSVRASGLFGGVSLRFRFGQRGDYLGNYIDLGFNSNMSLINQLVTKDRFKSDDPNLFLTQKITNSGLEYVNRKTYKVIVRIGFDRISLTGSYRLNKILKDDALTDLPKLELGIEFSPVRY